MIQNKDYLRIKMILLTVSMILYYASMVQISDEEIAVSYGAFVYMNIPVVLYPVNLMWLVAFKCNKLLERRMYILYQYTISLLFLFHLVVDIFFIFYGWREQLWLRLNNINTLLDWWSSFFLLVCLVIWQVMQYLLFLASEESPETEEKT